MNKEKVLQKLKALSDAEAALPVKAGRLLTGFYSFDYALRGGLPRGHAVEISGHPGCGKTTLALSIGANTASREQKVLFLSMEKNHSLTWMQKLGITDIEFLTDLEKAVDSQKHFHFYSPPYLETAFETIRLMLMLDFYDLIIVDSIGGAPTRAEIDASFEETQMTQLARLGHKINRVLPVYLSKSKASLLIINQVVTNMNYDARYPDRTMPWGGQYVPKGAAGWGFLFSVRAAIERAKLIFSEKTSEVIGKEFLGVVFKSRVGIVPKRFNYWLKVQEEQAYIDYPADIRETAFNCNIIEQRGAHWYYRDTHIAKSKQDCERWIQEEEQAVEMEKELAAYILNLDQL